MLLETSCLSRDDKELKSCGTSAARRLLSTAYICESVAEKSPENECDG